MNTLIGFSLGLLLGAIFATTILGILIMENKE